MKGRRKGRRRKKGTGKLYHGPSASSDSHRPRQGRGQLRDKSVSRIFVLSLELFQFKNLLELLFEL